MPFPFTFPVVFPGGPPPFENAGSIINQAAIESGVAPNADPVGAKDFNFVQLTQLLTKLGRTLWREFSWTHLRQEHVFTTVQGQADYDYPSDFGRMLDQTWWNRTNRLPVGGPLSEQAWQYLKARLVGVVFNVLFKPGRMEIVLYPDVDTPGDQQVAFSYVSRFWVQGETFSAPSESRIVTSQDIPWFDPALLVAGLKCEFLKAKGFDASAAQADYDKLLQLIIGDDSPAPTLNYNQAYSPFHEPLIGEQNIPLTGFGFP